MALSPWFTYPAELEGSAELDDLNRYVKLAVEFGYQKEAEETVRAYQEFLRTHLQKMNELIKTAEPSQEEPETLEEIRAQRPQGEHRLCGTLPPEYHERWQGSFSRTRRRLYFGCSVRIQ